jgi:hypothetical protein
MKKLSIGLLAMLAMIFAVASAFSTAEKQTVSQGWYLVDNNTIPATASVLDKDDFDQLIDPDFADEPTVGSSPCGSDEDVICAAYFEEDQEEINPVTSSLIVLGGKE